MFDLIHKINSKINKIDYSLLNANKKEQLKILKKYEPKEKKYINRSYAQYRCQMENKSIFKKLILNILSFILILPFILLSLLKTKNNYKDSIQEVDNIAIYWVDNPSVIPDSLKLKYEFKKVEKKYFLNKEDIIFLWKEIIKSYPFSFYFHFKIIFKMAIYRYNIEKYNPNCFIVFSEYSFTSSILTKFCNHNSLKHINVMHGDKLFYIRDSFFKFDKCYVWDGHYKELFIELKADPQQFVVETPKNFILNQKSMVECQKESNKPKLTYYLQMGQKDQLEIIKENLNKLTSNFDIIIRPHPRYCDTELVNEIFDNFKIEDTKKIDIFQSLTNTEYVTSLYSTVLYQGYLYQKKLIIDDLIDKRYYTKLKELNYIIINKPHVKLSDLINN